MDQNASGDPSAAAVLARLRDAPAIATIDGVVAMLEGLDSVLPAADGVRWFNLLYLLVTRAVYQGPTAGTWADPAWLAHLDVVFAGLYFDALAHWYTEPATVPRAWAVLFDARYRPEIERVQFALAGMNAHINHDLPIALVEACADRGVPPDRGGQQFADFVAVNHILSGVEPQALQYLSTGIVGMAAQDLGQLGHVLAMWSVATARDTAWTNAELGWQVRDLVAARERLLLVLDRMTGFAGRGLLIPVV